MKAAAVAVTVFAVALNQAAAGAADAPAPGEEAPDATPVPGEEQRPDAPDATATGKAAKGPATAGEPDAAQQPKDAAQDVFVPSEDISEDLSVRFPVDI